MAYAHIQLQCMLMFNYGVCSYSITVYAHI